MTRAIGHELPPEIFSRLNGSELDAHQRDVILVITVDADGWPHPSMISYFEAAAPDRGHVRLAMYAGSHTTHNLRERRNVTIAIVDRHLACYIKGTSEELAPSMRSAPYNAKLVVRVEHVLADAADPEREPGAYISSGITFTRPDSADAATRSRAVHSELME
jgi:hypothetical protein